MTEVSITQLKGNPSAAIARSNDYPVAIKSRNHVKAYVVGKRLYDTLVAIIEDRLDRKVIDGTNFKRGKNFEDVARELGI